MKRVLAFFLAAGMFMPFVPAAAEEDDTSFTILYTNDVHCAIAGYAPFSAYQAELEEQGKTVLAVDAGDCIQGELIGSYTKGEAIIDLMNEVPYDIAIPGNHEFEYQVPQFLKLSKERAKFPYVCCNYSENKTGETIFPPYLIREINGYNIGFVGIVTPETYIKSTPKYFKDENGNYLYSFHENDLYDTVQSAVDKAEEAGADIVIAVGHLGVSGTLDGFRSIDVIEHTRGIDAFIDGHSHETVEGPDYNGTLYRNLDGEVVPITQTGTKFAAFGEMTVTLNGKGKDLSVSVETHLIDPASVEVTGASASEHYDAVQKLIDSDNAMIDAFAGETIGTSDAFLQTYVTNDSKWLIRSQETNSGDFAADAYRSVIGADICVINAGSVRADVKEGEIKTKDLIAMCPWQLNNCLLRVSGQMILDSLECGASKLPELFGGFLQVSGLSYEVNTYYESPVERDEKGMMTGIDDSKPRRVFNVRVNGEPIDPDQLYTVATNQYLGQEKGDGNTALAEGEVISADFPTDTDIIIKYFKETLNGHITKEQYGKVNGEGRIIVHNEEAPASAPASAGSTDLPLWAKILVAALGAVGIWLLVRTPGKK